MRGILIALVATGFIFGCSEVKEVPEGDVPDALSTELTTDSSVPDLVPEIIPGGVSDVAFEDLVEAIDLADDLTPSDGTDGCLESTAILPAGLVELGRDDGGEYTSLAAQVDWSVLGEPTSEAKLYEAQRFDLEHPARVYGFSIRYGHLPEGEELAVVAGLYPDFGNNGFDFWQFESFVEVTRCLSGEQSGEWVDFVFDEPIEFAHPGPVYVAQLRAGAEEPAWAFDLTLPEGCEEPANCCGAFDVCASAWNFPELTDFVIDNQGYFNWNGLSLTLAYDYMVHLHVEYLDDLPADEKFFKKVEPGPAPGVHFAWGDYDADGWDDLLGGVKLYRNNEGEFEDISEAAGLGGLVGSGGAWGDYDNDGCLDLLIYHESYTGADHLLHNNCDGTFSDVTEESGIIDLQDYNLCTGNPDLEQENAPSNHAAWVDIDGDGFLDLYVTNYICWANWISYPDNVWHNEGDGTFTEWMDTHGFLGAKDIWMSGRGANPIDLDFDGDVDIMVNNYHLHRNFFYLNNGDGTVTETASEMGLMGHPDPFGMGLNFGHSCGVSWGDIDRDGDWDLIVANLAHPRFYNFSDKTQVMVNDGTNVFEDIQGDWSYPMGEAGIRYQEGHYVPVLGDIDQDGVLDLTIASEYNGRPTDFYWGNGDGTFELDTYHAGIDMPTGNCVAVADIDHDGDLDMGTRAAIWRNDLSDSDKGNWLQIRPIGNLSNNAWAMGATVRVHAGNQVYLGYVNGGTGQGCQDSLTVHFGLGTLDTIEFIEVDYPYSTTVLYDGPFDVNQRLWLLEDGEVHPGWAPPDAG